MNRSDSDSLHIVDTRSAREFQGKAFGIEMGHMRDVLIAFGIGAVLFAVLAMLFDAMFALAVSMLPTGLSAGYILLFRQNKPPGYARAIVESLVNGGNAAPPDSAAKAWLHSPLEDCQITSGLIFWGGPRRHGSVVAGYLIELPDLLSAGPTECNGREALMRQLLRMLPKDAVLQVQWTNDGDYEGVLRQYAAETRSDSTSRTQRTRNLAFMHFWGRRGELRRERVVWFVRRSVESSGAGVEELIQQLTSEFAGLGQELGAIVSGAGGRVVQLENAQLKAEFDRALTGRTSAATETGTHTTLKAPEIKGLGDGAGFYCDGFWCGTLLLRQWPHQTHPALFHRLTQIPMPGYSIHVRAERIDIETLIAVEQKDIDRLNNLQGEKTDERLGFTIDQKEHRIRRLSEGTLLPMSVEYTFLVRAATPGELQARLQAIKSAIHGLNGAQYLECTLPASARDAFLRTLPGNPSRAYPPLRLYCEEDFLVHLLPSSGSFTGCGQDALYSGRNGNLVGLKMFSGEGAAATPQHMLIFGSVGVGKSQLLRNLLDQTSGQFVYTVIIEEGLSQADHTRGFGVEPLVVDPNGRDTLNFLDTQGSILTSVQISADTGVLLRMAGVPNDEDRARHRSAVIAKYLTRLAAEHGAERYGRFSPADREQLQAEFAGVHALAQERDNTLLEAFNDYRNGVQPTLVASSAIVSEGMELYVYSRLPASEQLTLGQFRDYLELGADESDLEECERLATLLTPYCRGGNHGVFWDGPNTVLLTGRIAHFELGRIPESARDLKALAGFVLIHHVRQYLLTLPRAYRKRVIIEELSRFLEVPGGEAIALELFRQFRKFGVQCIATVQQANQIADPKLRSALLGNSRAFLIFNPGDRQDMASLGSDLGISAAMQATILAYPRPDQLAGQKYSECCYYQTDPRQPICGTVRHVEIPDNGVPLA